MDRAEVIKALEEWRAELDKISGSHTWQYRKKVLAETIAALREQEQNNEPLTLEDLQQMDGEPVWMDDLTGGTLWRQWIIFEKHTQIGFVPRGGGWFSTETYGEKWIAYRHKPPKEGTDHA